MEVSEYRGRFRNAKGDIQETDIYFVADMEKPVDFYDPDGVHWWLDGTEEPDPPKDELPVATIEEIIKKLRKYGSEC